MEADGRVDGKVEVSKEMRCPGGYNSSQAIGQDNRGQVGGSGRYDKNNDTFGDNRAGGSG